MKAGPETIATNAEGWWERERLSFLLREVAADVPGLHLDVGGGRGTFAQSLARSGSRVVCVDGHAYSEWQHSDRVFHVVAAADRLPFRAEAFDSVSALDVIEHLRDDSAAASELARVTAPGGVVTITVPASQRLWSQHDENVGHHRRYSRAQLDGVTAGAGLAVVRTTHFFSWLYPVAWATRRSRGALTGDEGGRLTTAIAGLICRAERAVLERFPLPFGTSLLTRARKKVQR